MLDNDLARRIRSIRWRWRTFEVLRRVMRENHSRTISRQQPGQAPIRAPSQPTVPAAKPAPQVCEGGGQPCGSSSISRPSHRSAPWGWFLTWCLRRKTTIRMLDADAAWQPAIPTPGFHSYEVALTSSTRLPATDRGALNAGSSDLAAQAEIEESGAATSSPLTCSEAHASPQRASSSETLLACSVVVGLRGWLSPWMKPGASLRSNQQTGDVRRA